MSNEGVVSKYLDHLQLRNLRHWTIYNRGRALDRLMKFVGQPVLYLTEQQLKDWQQVRSRQICPEALRTETSSLRSFYGWAQREGYRVDDPTSRLVMPRVVRRLPRPIADQKLAEAIEHGDPATRAILGLAAFAGLRACEISGLDWAEVGWMDPKPYLRVEEGKGGRGRHVPMSKALIALLIALPHRKGPVIVRLDGAPGPTKPHRISTRANNYLHDMGITETLHQLRHRFATAAYQACQDIRAVQDLLGHASPATTAIYAASSNAVAVDAVEAAGFVRSQPAA